MSSRLLQIPRELREQILDYVVGHRRAAPDHKHDSDSDLDLDDEAARVEMVTTGYMSWGRLRGIMWEPEAIIPNATSLFQTSRQIRAETIGALRRLPKDARAHSLDLLFVGERELWPTWTFVPTSTKKVNTLEVKLRIAGVPPTSDGFEAHVET